MQYTRPACLLAAALLVSGCKIGGSGGGSDNDTSPSYSATIERTTYGIPHISADTIGSAGYGHGYAIAEDNLCVLADAYVTFNGERSRYFGPDEPAAIMGTFGTPTNLEADFFFRFLLDEQQLDTFTTEQPDDLLELSAGFAAGYSRYVEEIQDGQHPDRHLDCRNAEWLTTITEADVLRRLVALNLAASSANWVEEIAAACPTKSRKSTRIASCLAAKPVSAATPLPLAPMLPSRAAACCLPTRTGICWALTASIRYT